MSQDFLKDLALLSDWMEHYRENIKNYPVMSQAQPNDLLKKLPLSPPLESQPFEKTFAEFQEKILPGITHWQHPKFFAYFPSNSSPPSVLAEMLIATLGVQGMSWITSPAATELEIRMMEWLREAFGLSSDFSGLIQDSASASTMTAMIVARERATDFTVNEQGMSGQNLVAYCSVEAHSSIEKAAKMIGLGRKNLRLVPVNENLEMRTDLLEEYIEADIAQGLKPFFVVGAFGTTSTTAVDNLDQIAVLAQKYRLWFHVDAAYAGSALILPEMRGLAQSIDAADSIVVNPHKWLMTTFDCSAFFIKDKNSLIRSFSILPEYLKTSGDTEEVVNFRDWGPGLGRRFRSLKLYFVLQSYGIAGLQKILRRHIHLSQKLESWIAADKRFEICAKRNFNLVCFRLKSTDQANADLLHKLNSSGRMFLSHTKIKGQYVIRLVVGQTDVQELDIREAWDEILSAAF